MNSLYSWQSLFLAIAISALTQAFKNGVDAAIGARKGGDGKAIRQGSRLLDGVVLPLFPLVLGASFGAFVPFHPDSLVAYVSKSHESSVAVYALWGTAVGQFADYLYQRVRKVISGPTPVDAPPVGPPESVTSPSDPPASDPGKQ